MYEFVNDNVW